MFIAKANGAEQLNFRNKKLYFKLNTTRIKKPTGRRQTSWLFTNVAEELNSGLP